MLSRVEMICEDVNILAGSQLTPDKSRAMMVCEDVNILGRGGGGGLAPHDLGALIGLGDGGPGDELGHHDCCSLFFVPASTQRAVVLDRKPQVWQPPVVLPEGAVPPSREPHWADQGPRLPRLVRRGVGGLTRRQTAGTGAADEGINRCTAPPGQPKCLFKWAASIPEQSIICADMPSLMYREMRAGGPTGYYAGYEDGGYGSESEEPNSNDPRQLLPPPECRISTSHAFTVATASSGVFFHCPCSLSECLATTESAAAWTTAPGVDSCAASSCYSPNSCSSASSVTSSRPPSPSCASFPSPSSNNWSPLEQQQLKQQQQQQYFIDESISSNNTNYGFKQQPAAIWQSWVDELVREVQAEIGAEKQLFCQRRKRSFDDSSDNSPAGSFVSPGPCSSVEPNSPFLLLCSSQSGASSSNASNSSRSSPCHQQLSGSSPPPSKRAKKNSLQTLSQEELAERKKQQNRAAAQRYRSRKTHTLEHEREEIDLLERCNEEMRTEQAALAEQIAALRAQLLASK